MPEETSSQKNAAEGEEKKPKCKACCACPETKRVRDACIIENGADKCQEEIAAHKKCMKEMGFDI